MGGWEFGGMGVEVWGDRSGSVEGMGVGLVVVSFVLT